MRRIILFIILAASVSASPFLPQVRHNFPAASSSAAGGGGGSPSPDIQWWKMNDGSGTTVAAAVGQVGTTNATWAVEGSGFATVYNGSSQHTDSNSAVAYSAPTSITVSVWVNQTNQTGLQVILNNSTTDGGVDGNWLIYTDSTPRMVAVCDGGGSDRIAILNSPYSTGAWHNIIVMFSFLNAGATKVWIDGILQSPSISGGVTDSTCKDFVLTTGADATPHNWYVGKIDDVRIYSGDHTSDVAAISSDHQ